MVPVPGTATTLTVLVALGGCRSVGDVIATETPVQVRLDIRLAQTRQDVVCTAEWRFAAEQVVIDEPIKDRPVTGPGMCSEPSVPDCRELLDRADARR